MTIQFNTYRRHIKSADALSARLTALVERARVLSETLTRFGDGDPRTIDVALACGVETRMNKAMLADGVRLGREAMHKLEAWMLDVRECGSDLRVLEMQDIVSLAKEAESELQGATRLTWLQSDVIPGLEALATELVDDLRRKAELAARSAA